LLPLALSPNEACAIIASLKEKELCNTTARINSTFGGSSGGKCEYIIADLKDKAATMHLLLKSRNVHKD
jgi:hypothetical protein